MKSNFSAAFSDPQVLKDSLSERKPHLSVLNHQTGDTKRHLEKSVERSSRGTKGILDNFVSRSRGEQEDHNPSNDPRHIIYYEKPNNDEVNKEGKRINHSLPMNSLENKQYESKFIGKSELNQSKDRNPSFKNEGSKLDSRYPQIQPDSYLGPKLTDKLPSKFNATNSSQFVKFDEKTKDNQKDIDEFSKGISQMINKGNVMGSQISKKSESAKNKENFPSKIVEEDEAEEEVNPDSISMNKRTAEFSSKDYPKNLNQFLTGDSSPLSFPNIKESREYTDQNRNRNELDSRPEVLIKPSPENNDISYTYSPHSPKSSSNPNAKYWKIKAIESKDPDIDRVMAKISRAEASKSERNGGKPGMRNGERSPYKTQRPYFNNNTPSLYTERAHRSPTSTHKIYDPVTAITNQTMINKYMSNQNQQSQQRRPYFNDQKKPQQALSSSKKLSYF